MSTSTRKNTLMDIFVKSLQKDNTFLKGQVAEQQKTMKDMEEQFKQEKKKQEFEMLELKEDLSTMVKDVATLQSKNTELTEKIEEYESCYVPASGSRKMKDALADARKQLRDVVEKYNSLVDTYDISRQQSASAITEANELRSENTRLQNELTKARQLYQASVKELEDNRVDMANIMKELSELKQAIADGTYEEEKEASKPISEVDSKLIASLRTQIGELTTVIERSEMTSSKSVSQSIADSQKKLEGLSNKVNALMRTFSTESKLVSLTSSIADFRLTLSAIDKAMSATSSPSNHRLEEAEKKVKELSMSLINITNERDRLLDQQEGGSTVSDNERIRQLEKEVDQADRKVIELSQRCQSFERSVKVLSTRADTAEKKVKELSASVTSLTKERDTLKKERITLTKERDTLTKERNSITKERNSLQYSLNEAKQQLQSTSKTQIEDSENRRLLLKKDEEISQLKKSITALESEVQQYQQEIEQLNNQLPPQTLPDLPDLPDLPNLPPVEHYFLPEELQEGEIQEEYADEDAEDAVATVLQQMIENPDNFNLDTIDDVSFPDCDFNDNHMMLFIRFLRENNLPKLHVIDVSSKIFRG